MSKHGNNDHFKSQALYYDAELGAVVINGGHNSVDLLYFKDGEHTPSLQIEAKTGKLIAASADIAELYGVDTSTGRRSIFDMHEGGQASFSTVSVSALITATHARFTHMTAAGGRIDIVSAGTIAATKVVATKGSFTQLSFTGGFSLNTITGSLSSYSKHKGAVGSFTTSHNTEVWTTYLYTSSVSCTGDVLGNKASFTYGSFANLSMPSTISGTKASFTNISYTNMSLPSTLSGTKASFTNGSFTNLSLQSTVKSTKGSFTNISYTNLTLPSTIKGTKGSFTSVSATNVKAASGTFTNLRANTMLYAGTTDIGLANCNRCSAFLRVTSPLIKGTKGSFTNVSVTTIKGNHGTFGTFGATNYLYSAKAALTSVSCNKFNAMTYANALLSKGTKASFTYGSFANLSMPSTLSGTTASFTTVKGTKGSFTNVSFSGYSASTISASYASISNLEVFTYASMLESYAVTSQGSVSDFNITRGTKGSFSQVSFSLIQPETIAINNHIDFCHTGTSTSLARISDAGVIDLNKNCNLIATRHADQTLIKNGPTTIIWDSKAVDPHNMLNTGTGIITFSNTGIYLINVKIALSASNPSLIGKFFILYLMIEGEVHSVIDSAFVLNATYQPYLYSGTSIVNVTYPYTGSIVFSNGDVDLDKILTYGDVLNRLSIIKVA